MICRREIANSFASTGIEYFNTYGGNSVACTIAEAVLDVILEEKLMENAYNVGQYIAEKFKTLLDRFDWVGDVRGFGLYQVW